jgi:chemotaxis protein methyltransferase CheR
MIYFDKSTQIGILEKIIKHMAAESLYFAGHSENFANASNILTPLGKTIYKPNRASQ